MLDSGGRGEVVWTCERPSPFGRMVNNAPVNGEAWEGFLKRPKVDCAIRLQQKTMHQVTGSVGSESRGCRWRWHPSRFGRGPMV